MKRNGVMATWYSVRSPLYQQHTVMTVMEEAELRGLGCLARELRLEGEVVDDGS